MLSYTLFHGTSRNNVQSILDNGFIKKPDPQDWLGHGVYFFTNGISCPERNSLEWARYRYGSHCKDSIAIVKTKATVIKDRVLDLTSGEGLERFNYYRDIVIQEQREELTTRRDLSIKKRKDFRIDDQIIMNMILEKIKIDLVVANLYIKNEAQRSLQLESCMPNSTVASVINPKVIDHSATVEVVMHRQKLGLVDVIARGDDDVITAFHLINARA